MPRSTTGRIMETTETYTQNIIERAVYLAGGPRRVAEAVGLSRPAVDKWIKQGFLPRTEWTGESGYAGTLEEMSGIHRADLLAAKPRRKISASATAK